MTRRTRGVRPRTTRVLLPLALTSALAGCGLASTFGDGLDDLESPCAVVIDASGSGKSANAKGRISGESSILQTFMAEEGCARIAFVALNGRSNATICKRPTRDLTVTEEGVEPADSRQTAREDATADALWVLNCAAKEEGGSDVYGALSRAVALRPPGPGPYHVLVVSDLVQADESQALLRQDLSTPASRQPVETVAARRLPRMDDLVLYPTDLAGAMKDGAQVQDIRTFWRELLARPEIGSPTLDTSYEQ